MPYPSVGNTAFRAVKAWAELKDKNRIAQSELDQIEDELTRRNVAYMTTSRYSAYYPLPKLRIHTTTLAFNWLSVVLLRRCEPQSLPQSLPIHIPSLQLLYPLVSVPYTRLVRRFKGHDIPA